MARIVVALGLGLLVLVAASTSGRADPPEIAEEEAAGPELIVSGSRESEPELAAPRAITVVTEEDMARRQPRSIPEALGEDPAVFLQETNRGAGAPIVRGLIGPQNLILVDGLPYNTSTFRTGPNQYLTLLDPFSVERIEVVRGPSSVLYGNGAMGGVVNVLTGTPQPSMRGGAVALRLRSADLAGTLAAEDQIGGTGWATLFGLSLSRFGELRTGSGRDAPLSEYESGGARAKLLVELDEAWWMTAAYLGNAVIDAGRTDQLGRGDVRIYDNTDHFASVRLGRDTDVGAWRGFDGALFYHFAGEGATRHRCDVDADGIVVDRASCLAGDAAGVGRIDHNDDDVHVVGAQAGARFALPFADAQLKPGVEASHEWISSSAERGDRDTGFAFMPASRGTFSDGSRYLNLGAYLQGEGKLFTITPAVGVLRLIAGLRASHFAASAPDVPDLGDVDYDDTGLTGGASLQLLAPTHAVTLSLHEGFRAPNLQETTALGDTGSRFEVPNDDLGPERSRTFELLGKLEVCGVSAQAAGYVMIIDDVIDVAPGEYMGMTEVGGKPVSQRVNRDRGNYRGIEVDVRYEVVKDIDIRVAGAWMRGDIELPDGEVPARRIPPAHGVAAIAWSPGNTYAELFVEGARRQERLHPADREDTRICEVPPYSGMLAEDCEGTAGWLTVNARAGVLLDRVRVDLALENILDDSYRRHGSGFDAAGFEAVATLAYGW